MSSSQATKSHVLPTPTGLNALTRNRKCKRLHLLHLLLLLLLLLLLFLLLLLL
jgi:hypothetical protein